jgi:hypothetical protein
LSWDLAYNLTLYGQLAWACSYAARGLLRVWGRSVPSVVTWVFFEGRPFIPTVVAGYCLSGALVHGTDGMGTRAFCAVGVLAGWCAACFEKDDDDRWRKRRAKAAERVRRVGARLQVVPAASGVK